MQTFVSTGLFIYLFSCLPCSISNQHMAIAEKCNKASVTVIGEQLHISEEIQLILSGNLAATGDCSPTVKLGLLKKNSNHTWDTIVNINAMGTLLCGPEVYQWSCDTVNTALYHFNFINYFKNALPDTSSYCFTYLAVKRSNVIMYQSNEFKIIN